jgi:hypothetical protein
MEIREILLKRSFVTRYSDQPVDPKKLRHVLEAAGNPSGFAQQHAVRFLVIEDAETRGVLKLACAQQRQRWLDNSVDWMHSVLEDSGEKQRLDALYEAPCVICVFGETDKPVWREVAWGAVERLRIAALSEGLQAELVTVESLDFLNALLDVPQTFSAVALLTCGEARQTQEPVGAFLDIEQLQLSYSADIGRLRFWNDPVRLGTLSQHSTRLPRGYLTDKQLLMNVIRTAAEIHSCEDINSVFDRVMTEMECFFRLDRSSVSFLDPKDNTVRLRNIHKHEGPLVGENALIPLDESNVIGWVMLNNSGVLRNNIASEDVFDEQMCSEELRSDMIVPIVSGKSVYGTLNCGSRSPNAFRPIDFEILREFGRLVGAAIMRLLPDSSPATGSPSGTSTIAE